MSVLSSSNATTASQQVGADWGFLQFTEVRAYRINWDKKSSCEPFADGAGRLNPSRIPHDGLPLNGRQVDHLHHAVTGDHEPHPVAMCFYPHHAFAFYDGTGTMVAHLDICFLCYHYRSSIKGFAEIWSLDALKEIVGDLGMPLSNPAWR